VPFLNIDAGELENEPDELYHLAHVLNIACGGHAGDEGSMRRVAEACKAHGTEAGAHPSYPDRRGFGRTSLILAAPQVERTVAEQCAALRGAAELAGIPLRFVKPHGALYHDANRSVALADAVVGAAIATLGRGFTLIGPPGGELASASARHGVGFAREGFADRGARPDGSLVPRGEPGAVVSDPDVARARAAELAAAGTYDTICVHGDTPNAVAIARAVRAALA